jgi:di/tricarboxylate transporter
VNAGLASLLLSLLLFIPGLGVMEVRGFASEVPWGSITLFAASMFLAKAVGQWRALDPVAEGFFDLLNLSSVDPLLFTVLLVLLSMFLHVGFTSTTVYATVMVPLMISLTSFQGMLPQAVAVPVAFLAPVAVILPVNTIPNIVFFSSGYFSQRQIIMYGIVVSAVSVALVLALGVPYWNMLGLV